MGLTLRGASHYLTVHQTEAEVKWRTFPQTNIDEDTINIMIVPFPYEFQPTWFSPSHYTTHRNSTEHTRYFDYSGPDYGLDPAYVADMLNKAEKQVNRVHIIVLPELALEKENLEEILNHLAETKTRDKLPLVLAGVRKRGESKDGETTLGHNQAVLAAFFAGKWYLTTQDKHHRWKIDERQIRQYNLGGVLASSKEWWEAIHIPRRQLSILASNQWFTLCSLICEDLARQEPIADIIRGIGPTLVIAILLDGPQLEGRWSGRYASVLADDPGSSVLSVTSLGFTNRSSPSPYEHNPTSPNTIAIWKDRKHGTTMINLPEGKGAAVITVTAQWVDEVTLAGRTDRNSGAVLVWQGCHFLEGLPTAYRPQKSADAQSIDDDHNLPLHFLESDRYDFRELSLFACLVDAAIDSDVKGIDDLRKIMLDADLEDCLVLQKPDNELHSLLVEALTNIRVENEKAKQADKPRDEVKPYVEWLCALMKALRASMATAQTDDVVLSKWDREVEWYTRIADYSEQILKQVPHAAAGRRWLDGDPFAKIRGNYPAIPPEGFPQDTFKEQLARIYIYVPLALLWALHSRLTDIRHIHSLNPKSSQLMHRIEAILAKQHDQNWRKNFAWPIFTPDEE